MLRYTDSWDEFVLEEGWGVVCDRSLRGLTWFVSFFLSKLLYLVVDLAVRLRCVY